MLESSHSRLTQSFKSSNWWRNLSPHSLGSSPNKPKYIQFNNHKKGIKVLKNFSSPSKLMTECIIFSILVWNVFFSYQERERQSSSFAFNFITSSSIHIWKMLSSRTHPGPKLAYIQCAPHTASRPENCVKWKESPFFAYCTQQNERKKNSSWYLCVEPWALCLLTPPKPEKGKKEWRKDCVWRLLCGQVTVAISLIIKLVT